MKRNEEFDAEELVALARMDMDKGSLEDALAKLKRAVASNEQFSEAHAMMAKIYAQMGLYHRAISYFEQYLVAHPEALVENFQLGMAYFDAKQPEHALRVWNELLNKQPAYPPALYYKGLLLAESGSANDSKEVLQDLVRSTASNNFYHEKAQELLNAIEANGNEQRKEVFAQSYN